MTESFSYSEFTPVKARKHRRNKNPRTSLSAVLATLREQLRQEEWFAQSSQIIKTSWDEFSALEPAVLCLGLGSPSASPIARIQLAFLAETCQQLNVAPDVISVFDPVFTAADAALCTELQMRVLAAGPAVTAAHVLRAPTLCFMPHCDIELYDALLRANWSAAGFANLFIVGNALQEYVDSRPLGALQAGVPCLLRAAPLLARRLLPPSRAWPTAFNNTAVQFRIRRAAPPINAPGCGGDDNDTLLFATVPWADPHSAAGGKEVPAPVFSDTTGEMRGNGNANAENPNKMQDGGGRNQIPAAGL